MAYIPWGMAPKPKHFGLAELAGWQVIWDGPLTLGTSNNSSALQCNVDTSNIFVMPLQLIFERESIPGASIKLDVGVSCNGQGLPVRGERVVCDGVVEELMNFWSRHDKD